GEITQITEPVLHDVRPSFDPEGHYLYFISYRVFDPVYDNLHFDLGFPRGARPHLVVLNAEDRSPFASKLLGPPKAKETDDNGDDENGENGPDGQSPDGPPPVALEEGEAGADGQAEAAANEGGAADKKDEETKKDVKVRIDLEDITRRVVAFPVEEGIYGEIRALKDGRVLYTRYPVEGALSGDSWDAGQPDKGELLLFTFEDREEESLVDRIGGFDLSRDLDTMAYRAHRRLRVLKAGSKPPKGVSSSPSRKSGWVDLSRIKISVVPGTEWRQMYRETWRLQREQFWTPDMSKVDWVAVHDRYLPLLDRVASRAEFSDLVWEMQGELGTSHAYEIGGDYRPEPSYDQGYLGAE
ncbi:MAG TPA: hypothetical protein VLA15_08145, partial [Desulfurivibrionaceae bacterium]|nr:hypothetical protein [Desulfurivibrionaceae bacterium]